MKFIKNATYVFLFIILIGCDDIRIAVVEVDSFACVKECTKVDGEPRPEYLEVCTKAVGHKKCCAYQFMDDYHGFWGTAFKGEIGKVTHCLSGVKIGER